MVLTRCSVVIGTTGRLAQREHGWNFPKPIRFRIVILDFPVTVTSCPHFALYVPVFIVCLLPVSGIWSDRFDPHIYSITPGQANRKSFINFFSSFFAG